MSEVALPYVAPWATAFRRYSTQLYRNPVAAGITFLSTIPSGQWWRIMFAGGGVITDATVVNRYFGIQVLNPPTTTAMFVETPHPQAASEVGHYLIGPGLSAVNVTGDPSSGYGQAPMPDMLWPPTSRVQIFLTNAQGGDTANAVFTLAVEVYGEDYALHIANVSSQDAEPGGARVGLVTPPLV